MLSFASLAQFGFFQCRDCDFSPYDLPHAIYRVADPVPSDSIPGAAVSCFFLGTVFANAPRMNMTKLSNRKMRHCGASFLTMNDGKIVTLFSRPPFVLGVALVGVNVSVICRWISWTRSWLRLKIVIESVSTPEVAQLEDLARQNPFDDLALLPVAPIERLRFPF